MAAAETATARRRPRRVGRRHRLVAAPDRALPGDHAALVLLTTAPSRATGIAVRLRVGVVVLVRVAGRIVHRLELGSLEARRRVLVATVVNRGNVAELSRVRISLSRRGHVSHVSGPPADGAPAFA